MKTVQKIIDLFGGLEALKERHIKILVEGMMPLVIEYVGEGPRRLPMISVAHYFTQNGDPMRDPEIVFEIVDRASTNDWLPVFIQQDPVGSYQEAVYRDENGRTMIRPKLVQEILSFSKMWDRNIQAQGYLKTAEKMAQEVSRG